MFWSLRENIGGLKHLSALTARVVLRQNKSKYIQGLNREFPDLDLKPAFDDYGQPLTCRFCGFVILSANLGTHQFAACSAVADNVILHMDRIVEFTKTVPTFENIKLESSQKKLLK